MDREIKFKGKRIDNGETIYGYYVYTVEWDKAYIYRQELVNSYYVLVKHEVDPKTVGQYTGLKDKNGKEIYEGDFVMQKVIICRNKDNAEISKILKSIVIFENGMFRVKPVNDHVYIFDLEKWEVYNPQLLEGK